MNESESKYISIEVFREAGRRGGKIGGKAKGKAKVRGGTRYYKNLAKKAVAARKKKRDAERLRKKLGL